MTSHTLHRPAPTPASMCGIFGVTGRHSAVDDVLDGLRKLEYRGYDSAGIAFIDDNILQRHRLVGRVGALIEQMDSVDQSASIAIGHTRWATTGAVTEANAHPHFDISGRIAIVHNGIIEQTNILRQRLIDEGVELHSETDTELIAVLTGMALDEGAASLLEALKSVLSQLRGTWGICAIHLDDPETIVCTRSGSPLVVGLSDDASFVSSDPHALARHTKRVVYLEDGDFAVLQPGTIDTSRIDRTRTKVQISTLEEVWQLDDLGNHPNHMHKEINEQPESLARCFQGRLDHESGTGRLGGLEMNERSLTAIESVELIGCGTAHHAGSVGVHLLEAIANRAARSHIGSEFRISQNVTEPTTLHIALSQSGETYDTLNVVQELNRKGADVIGIVNVVGSSIARACGRGVYIRSGPEQAVASTKAFTNTVGVLSLVSIMLGRSRSMDTAQGRRLVRDLSAMPNRMATLLDNLGTMDEAVSLVKDAKVVLFLGRGISSPVAAEGALKLMEIAYIPTIALPAGEIKHGPLALIEEGTPVIVLMPGDEHAERMVTSIDECKARGAKIILIHDEHLAVNGLADVAVPIPSCESLFSPLLSVLPLQVLSYEVALALGRDIDRPRNLAKSVTVG